MLIAAHDALVQSRPKTTCSPVFGHRATLRFASHSRTHLVGEKLKPPARVPVPQIHPHTARAAHATMKMFTSLIVLAVAHLAVTSSSALAQDTATATTADLTAEFLSWKASAVGQQAYASGFVPEPTKESVSAGPTDEELRRFQAAKVRVAEIQKTQPLAQFSVETPFALLTPDEFNAYVNKGGVQEFRQLMEARILAQGNITAEFASVSTTTGDVAPTTPTRQLEVEAQQGWVVDTDWQTKGCVTRIKDQGQCGSCTMFATTAALESGYCIKTGKLIELSEQEVISCNDRLPGYSRCGGWNIHANFQWVSRMNDGSLCTEASYPYASASGKAPGCRRYEDPNFSCVNPNIGARMYAGGNFADHTRLENAVRQQPVAVDMNMVDEFFQYYKGGVLRGDESKCTGNNINHGVLIVGFGWLDGVPYWKVKNQWGTNWGDNGWFYLERGYQGHEYGTCGIESLGYYPIFPDAADPRIDMRCKPRFGVQVNGVVLAEVTAVEKPNVCCDACRANPKCEGYTWFQSRSTCQLLSSVTGETTNTPLVSGARITTKAAELQLQIGVITDNLDYPGNDIMPVAAKTAEDCGDKCNQYDNCNAFTWTKWNKGMCYFKESQPLPQSVAPSPDGSPMVRSGILNKCQEYQFGVDFAGGDLNAVDGVTFDKCCGRCRGYGKCAAFTWADVDGGTCYLKEVGYTVVPRPNEFIISATL